MQHKDIDILLIYPQLGSFDNIIRDIPLSLIYAATDSVKNGFRVKIIDFRIRTDDWKQQIDAVLEKGVSLIGISVMTGKPIETALAISEYVKSKSDIPIVWGGPHPTILPEQTLENEYIDFVIRDWGSKALHQLIQLIKGELVDISLIKGLGFKRNGTVILNAPQCSFEMLDFRDIPYELVDIKGSNYCRLGNGELVFPIYTSIGCPYQCTFCMSPAVYSKIQGKKWLAYEKEYVLDQIDFLIKRYNPQRFQSYDDDSFVDIDRMYELLKEYVNRGYNSHIKFDFRGARINELDKMDDDFLSLMVRAGVEIMAIGAESGSQRSLDRMNKNITVEQIVRVNKKLSKYPSLKPHYNLFCGIPGEEILDLIETKELLMQLVKDNPNCYLGVANDWKPIPGSKMTDMAVVEYGLKLPDNLREWATIDTFDSGKIVHPWYTKDMDDMIKLLQIAGLLLDNKLQDIKSDLGPVMGKLIYFIVNIYRPFLSLRLKRNWTGFLFEHTIKSFAIQRIGKLF